MPDSLLVFALAALALLAVPGPSVLYIVARSASQGRRAGFVSMLGIEAGGLVHVFAAAVGVSAIVASSATAFSVLKYAGAAYLIYLGVRKLLERGGGEVGTAGDVHSLRRLFWEGVLVNVLNPKTAIFFLAFLPQFVDPDAGAVYAQVLLLGVVFISLAVLSDGAYALAAGAAGGWLRSRGRRRLWLDRASGAIYIALGVSAALSERPARVRR
jgi:threonine/homoserine/homoserine lactone efflux protein